MWSLVVEYHFSEEVLEMVLQHARVDLLCTVSSLLLYFMGQTMRNMSMSLANQSFMNPEFIDGTWPLESEKRLGTQQIIDQRLNCEEL